MKKFGLFFLMMVASVCPPAHSDSLSTPTTTTAIYTSTAVASVVKPGAAFSPLFVSEVLPQRITVSWSQNYGDEQGYVVERVDYTGKIYSKILPKDSLRFIDTTVVADAYYRYRVYAFKGSVKTASATIDLYANPLRPLPAVVQSCKVQVISECERVFAVKATVGKAQGTGAFVSSSGTITPVPTSLPAPALNFCAHAGKAGGDSNQAFCTKNLASLDGNLTIKTDACSNDMVLVAWGTKEASVSPQTVCEEFPIFQNW